MKKIIAFALALTLLIAFGATSSAAAPPSKYSAIPTEGTPSENGVGSAEGFLSSLARAGGLEITTWRNQLTEVSPGYLNCYSKTVTNITADEIQNEIALQQWNGTSWVTYSSSTGSLTDTDLYIYSIYRNVARGYNYRLKTTHKAWYALAYDQEVLYSSYIYVP